MSAALKQLVSVKSRLREKIIEYLTNVQTDQPHGLAVARQGVIGVEEGKEHCDTKLCK